MNKASDSLNRVFGTNAIKDDIRNMQLSEKDAVAQIEKNINTNIRNTIFSRTSAIAFLCVFILLVLAHKSYMADQIETMFVLLGVSLFQLYMWHANNVNFWRSLFFYRKHQYDLVMIRCIHSVLEEDIKSTQEEDAETTAKEYSKLIAARAVGRMGKLMKGEN